MPQNLDKNLGFLLHDVARLLRKRFDQRARALGLSRAQWSVLAHLARHDGIKQSALAEILEIEPITLVRLVDRLEAAGWVERRPHESDRRVKLLQLTAKAHPLLEELWRIGAATREEAMTGLTTEMRERLIETLLTIKKNLLTTGTAQAAPRTSHA